MITERVILRNFEIKISNVIYFRSYFSSTYSLMRQPIGAYKSK